MGGVQPALQNSVIRAVISHDDIVTVIAGQKRR